MKFKILYKSRCVINHKVNKQDRFTLAIKNTKKLFTQRGETLVNLNMVRKNIIKSYVGVGQKLLGLVFNEKRNI